MMTEGGKEKDIFNCKETIRALITEIELTQSPGAPGDPSGHNR